MRAYRIRRWSVSRLTQPLPGGDIDATLSDRPGPSVIPLLSSFGHAASYVSAARPCSTDLRLASFYWCRAPDMKNRLRLRCAPVRPIYAWHHSFGVDLRTCRIPAFYEPLLSGRLAPGILSTSVELRISSIRSVCDALLSDRPAPGIIPLLSSSGHAPYSASSTRSFPVSQGFTLFHSCRASDLLDTIP